MIRGITNALLGRKEPHPGLKAELTLRNIEKLLEEDKKLLSAHPILKHLYERIAAVAIDVDEFGHHRTPVESTKEFVGRVNDLLVERQSKDYVKRKSRSRRTAFKAEQKQRKATNIVYRGTKHRG